MMMIFPLWTRVERQAPNYHWRISTNDHSFIWKTSQTRRISKKHARWSLKSSFRNSENRWTNIPIFCWCPSFSNYNLPSKKNIILKDFQPSLLSYQATRLSFPFWRTVTSKVSDEFPGIGTTATKTHDQQWYDIWLLLVTKKNATTSA